MLLRYKIAILVGLMFVPTVIQFLTIFNQNYFIGLAWKIIFHIAVPVVIVAWLSGTQIREQFIAPIKAPTKKDYRKAVHYGLFFGFAGALSIFLAYIFIGKFVDFDQVINSLNADYEINKAVFPFVALWIAFGNPFMEEYFWRGFVYRNFHVLAKTKTAEWLVLIGTGLVFALHHTVIIRNWFEWWIFILVTIFLALVGVLFNWMYRKTNTILASLITHILADIAIILIGLHLFGFY